MTNTAFFPRAATALVLMTAICGSAVPAHAQKTWSGASSADWHTAANWSGGGVPVDGDAVTITAAGGGVLLAADTAALGSLTISNNTLTCTNWTTTINCTNVTIRGSGRITLPGRFRDTEMSNRVHVVCVNLTIEPGGMIDADACGYYPEDGPGAPKNTWNGGDDREGGAGYGGRGGAGDRDTGQSFQGYPYGDAAIPIQPGSGGGSDAGVVAQAGGGGGAIYIDASGTVTVNGTVTADGGDSQHAIAAAGSGGGIYISCDTFQGSSNGLIRARGGDAFGTVDVAGGGGGGRIAIDYGSVGAQADVRFSCSPARVEYAIDDLGNRWWSRARMGTLWLPDASLLSTTLTSNRFTDCRIMGLTSWSPASLTVSNCSVAFGEDGVVITVAGDVRVDSGGKLGIGDDWAGNTFTMHCGGDLAVTNGGNLWAFGGMTNGATPDYGALVSVTGDVAVGPSSWIYSVPQVLATNGGAPLLTMANLYVAKGGGISANATGYGPNSGPGSGTGNGSTSPSGAGHGGEGGSNWGRDSYLGGRTYGSAAMPLTPGSGGNHHNGHIGVSGSGGGVIRIDASGTVTVDGTVTAKGALGLGAYGSAGSGGSVYLKCNTFGGSTNGLISVQGGDHGLLAANDLIGAGGGGRIALDYQSLDTDYGVVFSTAPGDEDWATVVPSDWLDVYQFRAQAGTLWLSKTDLLTSDLSGNRFQNVRLFGPTSWSPASLTVSNCWISFCEPGFELDVAGDVVVAAGGVLGIGDETAGSNYALRCGGSLAVTNGGVVHVYSGQAAGTWEAGALLEATGDVVVGSGSTIYLFCHSADGDVPKCTMANLHVAAGGAIDADGRGFASWKGPGAPDSDSSGGGGGAYGGRGGMGYANTYGYIGYAYGDANLPLQPGSGAGTYSGGHTKMGGRGGGLVWLEASGDVTVDGTVSANGQKSLHTYGGGGSGGAVYLKCSTFGGSASGLLTAEGGDGRQADDGGGGGGRIAVDYGSLAATHDTRFSAAPSDTSWALLDTTNYWQYIPRPGSLSLPDGELLGDTLPNSRLAGAVNLWFQDISEWAVDSLTISNGWVGFGQDDFVLTVSNDLIVSTDGKLAIGEYSFGSNTTLRVGGDLVLTNGGSLCMLGGLTNAMGQGDVSVVVEVTNDVVVRSGSWIFPASHDTDGGSPVLRMRHLAIDDGGGINADSKGYRAMAGPGRPPVAAPSYGFPAGGGYGGKGGGSTNEQYDVGYAGGPTYGQTNGPALPGSGGAVYTSYASDPVRLKTGGVGGGPVRVEARGDVTVNGTITANGTAPLWGTGWYGGSGGSGGGISILSTNFTGGATAVLRADGSDSYDAYWKRGAGGGGRIVVWNNVPEVNRTNYLAGGAEPDLVISDVFAEYWGAVSATNGQGSVPGHQAEAGTAYYVRKALGGTYELRIEGTPDLYDTPGPLSYGVNPNIPENSWITNTVTSPADEAAGQRWACLGFELDDSLGNPISNSTSTQAVFQLTTNMVLTWHWTNEWLLATDQGANGTVNTGAVNGWYTNGVTAPDIVASPDGGHIFNTWVGDFPVGKATDNPLSVTMDQARWITGTFAVATIETNTWGGTGTWNSATNWDLGHVPKSIDHAVIGSGQVIIDTPKYMASLIVSNGATLVFTNWTTTLNVNGDVTVQSNGVITAYRMVTNGVASNRVHIVCTNLTVELGGAIDVRGKGYAPWDGPGSDGHIHNAAIHSGGSYGGLGGWGAGGGGSHYGGSTYGTPNAPLLLGSGGGSRDRTGGSYPDFRSGSGWGGGAIRIDASGAVTVDGTVSADGGDATDVGQDYTSAGSGGSIYMTCATLGGSNGVIRANGGAVPNAATFGGGGGGGRIAVDYQGLGTPRKLRISTAPGAIDWGRVDEDQRWPWAARMGTLWLPDTNLLASPVTDNLFSNCCLVIDGVTSLAVDSLTISNVSFSFADPGFELHVANDLVIGSGGELGIGGYYDTGSDFLLAVGGSIVVTNGGKLHVYAGETNGTPGDVATLVAVTNDLVIGPGSQVVPYCNSVNGSTVRFEAENLSMASGSAIRASGRGYRSRLGPGSPSSTSYASGGSHGGRGGLGAATQHKGSTYGSVHAPIQPGSSAGTYNSDTHWYHATPGGGVVRVKARSAATVNGIIDASGVPLIEVYAACGSGGSVYLECDTFGGSGGLIRADGGSTSGNPTSGPGGGGRIAVDYSSVAGTPTVAFSAVGGANGWATTAGYEDMRIHHVSQDGTLSLPDTTLLSAALTDQLFVGGVRLYFQNASSWSPPSLTVSNCSVNFAGDGFALNVAGDVRVDAGGVLGLGDDDDGSNYVLNCANLVVTNGGIFNAHAGQTNNPSVQTYGTLVNVTGDIAIGPSSAIHPWAQRDNGATVQFRAVDVLVSAGGAVQATGRGYYSRQGPGAGEVRGDEGAGGGYGGRGGMGNNSLSLPGEPYGSTNAPVDPGSSGGTHGSGYEHRGASGGGAVRIEASGRLTLNGTIAADGADAWVAPWTGGASGGSVYLFCGDFKSQFGAGLYARGGKGSNGQAGPGGGGRIAVWENISDADRTALLAGTPLPRILVTNSLSEVFAGGVSVAEGSAGYVHPTTPALPGTLRYFVQLPPQGSLFIVR